MNSNPILNREIVTRWNGVAQAAERNEHGKSYKTKLIHTNKNKLFWHCWIQSKSSIMSQTYSKNILFVKLFHTSSKKIAKKNFLLRFAFNFFPDLRVTIKFCGRKSAKLSVTGLTKRETKKCQLLPLCRMRQPCSRKIECLNTIPFARNPGTHAAPL